MKWAVRIGLMVVLASAGFYKFYLDRRPLAPRLVSIDDNTRNQALPELMQVPQAKRPAVASALLEFRTDLNPAVRRNALYALRQIEPVLPEMIAFAATSLGDADHRVREEAMASLSRFGEPAIPALIGALSNANRQTREGASQVLTNLEARAVPALIAAVKDPATPGRGEAVLVIKKIGAPATEAVPVLAELLADNNAALRLSAAEALDAFEKLPAASVATLSKDLLDAKESYSDPLAPRPRLAKLLEKIDPRRRAMVDLGFDLKQRNAGLRYRAAYVISEMDPPNIGALPILIDALEDKDPTVSSRALVALTRIGLPKTERLKDIAHPRVLAAAKRGEEAGIEGFKDIVGPALPTLP